MESEKVKEIKKVLEQNTKTCLLYDFEKNADCKVFQCKYILDYINELESENYKLEQNLGQCENGYKLELHTARYQLHSVKEDLKKAEKRIAELEKEIEENAFYSKGYADGIKNTYEVVIPDKLKQFAEMLKEKSEFYHNGQKITDMVTFYDIDETLKEFIK